MLAPGAGKLVWLYDLGVRFMVSGAQTEGRFALVEHPIRPKALAAPLHTHADEEAADLYASGPRDAELAAELRRRYRLDMDLSSIARLLQVHGLAGS